MSDATDLEPLLIGVEQVSELTNLGKTSIYALIKSGELRPAKIGHKTVFSYAEVRDFAARVLAKREQDEQQAAARSAEFARRRTRVAQPQQQTQW